MTLKNWVSLLDLRGVESLAHIQAVSKLAVTLALEMGLSETNVREIHHGALLHDIGMLALPDHISRKPEPLDPSDWKLIQKHPIIAHELLKDIPLLSNALEIPYCHHENWDGSGYPCGLQGSAIPLSARIFSIVDGWDSLTSNRPFRAGWPKCKTLKFIESQAGIKYDPEIVAVFVRWIRETEFGSNRLEQ